MPLSLPPSGHRRLVAVGLVALIVLAVAWRQFHRADGAAPLAVAPLVSGTTTGTTPTGGGMVVVDVVGGVRRPGLYRLATGARVADAVSRAGGLTRRADRALVNLAAPLVDGEQVLVAVRGSAAGVTAAGAAAPVHLNSATAEELDTLPGVGPVTAEKIVAYRQQNGPFSSLDGLDAIPGIGPARIAALKGLAVP